MKGLAGKRPGRRAVVMGAVFALWLVALVAVAVPAWKQALVQHREVKRLERHLSELDRWTVAGLWLEKSLAPQTARVEPVWTRLFPNERRCEELFLDLARVADVSGVDRFELSEVMPDEMAGQELGIPDEDAAAALSGYRVRARFEGNFAEVTEFLGGLHTLERAVSVHNLEITPTKAAVQVDLELDIYVATTTES